MITDVVSGAVADLGQVGVSQKGIQGQGGSEGSGGAFAVEFQFQVGAGFGHTAADYDMGPQLDHFSDDAAGSQIEADGNLPQNGGVIGQSLLLDEKIDQII